MKSENVVAQSCLTSLRPHGLYVAHPVSSVHGTLQARILQWVAILFSKGLFPTPKGLNPSLLYCRQILYHVSYLGSP